MEINSQVIASVVHPLGGKKLGINLNPQFCSTTWTIKTLTKTIHMKVVPTFGALFVFNDTRLNYNFNLSSYSQRFNFYTHWSSLLCNSLFIAFHHFSSPFISYFLYATVATLLRCVTNQKPIVSDSYTDHWLQHLYYTWHEWRLSKLLQLISWLKTTHFYKTQQFYVGISLAILWWPFVSLFELSCYIGVSATKTCTIDESIAEKESLLWTKNGKLMGIFNWISSMCPY